MYMTPENITKIYYMDFVDGLKCMFYFKNYFVVSYTLQRVCFTSVIPKNVYFLSL